ncbi:MAG: hypothetical protein MI784_15180, partial [Cytophagales bacterium]|nr:hypothetical protein [Cytophagales bacterium]
MKVVNVGTLSLSQGIGIYIKGDLVHGVKDEKGGDKLIHNNNGVIILDGNLENRYPDNTLFSFVKALDSLLGKRSTIKIDKNHYYKSSVVLRGKTSSFTGRISMNHLYLEKDTDDSKLLVKGIDSLNYLELKKGNVFLEKPLVFKGSFAQIKGETKDHRILGKPIIFNKINQEYRLGGSGLYFKPLDSDNTPKEDLYFKIIRYHDTLRVKREEGIGTQLSHGNYFECWPKSDDGFLASSDNPIKYSELSIESNLKGNDWRLRWGSSNLDSWETPVALERVGTTNILKANKVLSENLIEATSLHFAVGKQDCEAEDLPKFELKPDESTPVVLKKDETGVNYTLYRCAENQNDTIVNSSISNNKIDNTSKAILEKGSISENFKGGKANINEIGKYTVTVFNQWGCSSVRNIVAVHKPIGLSDFSIETDDSGQKVGKGNKEANVFLKGESFKIKAKTDAGGSLSLYVKKAKDGTGNKNAEEFKLIESLSQQTKEVTTFSRQFDEIGKYLLMVKAESVYGCDTAVMDSLYILPKPEVMLSFVGKNGKNDKIGKKCKGEAELSVAKSMKEYNGHDISEVWSNILDEGMQLTFADETLTFFDEVPKQDPETVENPFDNTGEYFISKENSGKIKWSGELPSYVYPKTDIQSNTLSYFVHEAPSFNIIVNSESVNDNTTLTYCEGSNVLLDVELKSNLKNGEAFSYEFKEGTKTLAENKPIGIVAELGTRTVYANVISTWNKISCPAKKSADILGMKKLKGQVEINRLNGPVWWSGVTQTFVAKVGNGQVIKDGLTYEWRINGKQLAEKSNTLNYKFSLRKDEWSKTFKVSVTVSYAQGTCPTTVESDVTVHQLVLPTLSLDKNAICSGEKALVALSWAKDSSPDLKDLKIDWGELKKADGTDPGQSTRFYIAPESDMKVLAEISYKGKTQQVSSNIKVHALPVFKPNLASEWATCGNQLIKPLSEVFNNETGVTCWWKGSEVNELSFSESQEVKLKLRNEHGCESEEKQIDVTVAKYDGKDLSFALDISACTKAKAKVNVPDAENSKTTFHWIYEEKTITDKESNSEWIITESGKYSVSTKYQLNDNLVCESKTHDFEVGIFKWPKNELNNNEYSLCAGEDVLLDSEYGSEPEEYDFSWFLDDVKIGGAVESTLSVSNGGVYKVDVVRSGCTGAKKTFTINVTQHELPDVPIINLVKTSFCAGDVLTASLNNPKLNTTYTWYIDGEAVGNSNKLQHQLAEAGEHTIKVKAANEKGCEKHSEEKKITVNNRPKASFEAKKVVCRGASVTLSSKQEADKYDWKVGASTHNGRQLEQTFDQ